MQKTAMAVGLSTLALLTVFGAGGQEREMNVTHGPESIFGRPAQEVLATLRGAEPTGENGRVGAELVFWGYRQADGREVFFFACAQLEEVDCPQRLPAICPNGSTVLQSEQASGDIVRRTCRPVAVSAPGERRPGCNDHVVSVDMLVGLVSCG